MPRREKFSKKSLRALSSWNLTWDGVESAGGKEEDAPEQTIFQEEKTKDMNAIKHATRPKIQTTF